ncbi:MAG: SAM-dependent methyltransferase [Erysipelotrichaceae bacterium]|nr:SAM-dependent methyltransferase [Erysipelotrichaceae bacterium]
MISKRIRYIASLIDDNESVADVGCDHAYLAVLLKENGHKAEIVCTDNKPGPLKKARHNLDAFGCRDVKTVMTDGVSGLDDCYDVTVMAGMGCHTVIHIMEDNPGYFRHGRLIIQINTEIPMLRRWLNGHDFMITNEHLVKDRRFYEILEVKSGIQSLNEQEIEFGPCFLKKKGELWQQYCQYRIAKLRSIADRLNEEHPDRIKLEEEIKRISTVTC